MQLFFWCYYGSPSTRLYLQCVCLLKCPWRITLWAMLQTLKGKSFQSLFWYSIVAMLQSIFEQVEFSFVICRTSICDWNFKKSYIGILKYIVLYKKCVVEIIAIRLIYWLYSVLVYDLLRITSYCSYCPFFISWHSDKFSFHG